MKSVWGSTSPFPGVLSGTPQQGTQSRGFCSSSQVTKSHVGPTQHGHDFTNFDEDQPSSMVRSLHLDADDEPRRFNLSSRANSVRFDESANTQWPHSSRPSMDFIPRAIGGLGHPMFERSASHKSDGRQSSAGQSAVSGRANSLGLEIGHSVARTPEPPGLAPGLFILGSVPSIIRCWVTSEFKHDSLLYAAVCSGSYRSIVEARLVEDLGLGRSVSQDINGRRRIKLPVFLPEAISYTTSSRSSSPTPSLPSLMVDFTIVDSDQEESNPRSIQIFLGSDTLRAHNADILLSQNTLVLYDDDRNKLSIPMVRPEHEETFKTLRVTSSSAARMSASKVTALNPGDDIGHDVNGFEPVRGRAESKTSTVKDYGEVQAKVQTHLQTDTTSSSPNPGDDDLRSPTAQETSIMQDADDVERTDGPDAPDHMPLMSSASRTNSSPAIWSNWRRDGSSQAVQNDWANVSRSGSTSYQRPNRDQGIKVLKPIRQASRPAISTASGSPVSGQSRFFDEGKRRSESAAEVGDLSQIGRSVAPSENIKPATKDASTGGGTMSASASASTPKPSRGNAAGGAMAFGWLNSGQR